MSKDFRASIIAPASRLRAEGEVFAEYRCSFAYSMRPTLVILNPSACVLQFLSIFFCPQCIIRGCWLQFARELFAQPIFYSPAPPARTRSAVTSDWY